MGLLIHKTYSRELLQKALSEGAMFHVMLWDKNGSTVSNFTEIPVQDDTCKLIEGDSGIGICFDIKRFLLHVNKENIKALKDSGERIIRINKKIKDVLGDVPVVDKLDAEIRKYQQLVVEAFKNADVTFTK